MVSTIAFSLVGLFALASFIFVGWKLVASRALPRAHEQLEQLLAKTEEDHEENPDAWSHFAEDHCRSNIGAPQWREWHSR